MTRSTTKAFVVLGDLVPLCLLPFLIAYAHMEGALKIGYLQQHKKAIRHSEPAFPSGNTWAKNPREMKMLTLN